jgi:hypothetical protein
MSFSRAKGLFQLRVRMPSMELKAEFVKFGEAVATVPIKEDGRTF